MSTRHAVATPLALALAAAAASSQDINITSGNVAFTKDFHADALNFFPATAGSDFLRCAPAGDAAGVLFTSAFLYRTSTDTRERPFNDVGNQAVYSNSGDTGTATWADMDGRGLFRAVVTYRAVSTGASSGVVIAEAALTNIGSSAITLTLFHFADMDLCGAAFNTNSSTSGSNGRTAHTSSCGETAEMFVRDFDRWETQISGDLYTRLSNAAIDNLASNPGAAGPGDVRACFQWSDRTIEPGCSETFVVQLAHNDRSCGASASFYGPERPISSGFVDLAIAERPIVGRRILWQQSGAFLSGTQVILVKGLSRVNTPIGGTGLTLLADPMFAANFGPPPGVPWGFQVFVPSNTALCGGAVYAQFFFVDPNGRIGQSRGTKILVGTY